MVRASRGSLVGSHAFFGLAQRFVRILNLWQSNV
jgi:hypothetical protein